MCVTTWKAGVVDRPDEMESVLPDEFLILMQSLPYFSFFKVRFYFVVLYVLVKKYALDISVNIYWMAFYFSYKGIVELGFGFLFCFAYSAFWGRSKANLKTGRAQRLDPYSHRLVMSPTQLFTFCLPFRCLLCSLIYSKQKGMLFFFHEED